MSWSENSIVELIRKRLGTHVAKGARKLLDDGALLPWTPRNVRRVISCDSFEEGNDFLTDLSSVESAGYRAIVQNLSDLAAMGAKPVGFVWCLGVPERWLDAKGKLLAQFCDGVAQACEEYRLNFYTGDLSLSKDRFTCAITVFGDVVGSPHSRQRARAGDNIFVSRKLGLSAFGLDVLLSRRQKMDASLRWHDSLDEVEKLGVQAHLAPKPELKLGRKLIGSASACMDISDGLLRDLSRLCGASKVGAELDALSKIIHPALPEAKARDYALHGGEEYALLFTMPPSLKPPKRCLRIGSIVRGSELIEVVGDNRIALVPEGYDHFISRS